MNSRVYPFLYGHALEDATFRSADSFTEQKLEILSSHFYNGNFDIPFDGHCF